MADPAQVAWTVVTWVWYIAAVGMIAAAGGYTALTRWVRAAMPEPARRDAAFARLRRVGLGAATAVVVLALVRIALRAGMASGGLPDAEAVRSIASDTSWGTGWWGQLYVGLLALAAMLIAGRRRRQGWSLGTAAALGLAYTLPMTADGGAAIYDPWRVAFAALHVFGGGIWLGAALGRLAARTDLGGAARPLVFGGAAVALLFGVLLALRAGGTAVAGGAVAELAMGKLLLLAGGAALVRRGETALAVGAAILLLSALAG